MDELFESGRAFRFHKGSFLCSITAMVSLTVAWHPGRIIRLSLAVGQSENELRKSRAA
jgi:hypothetical protein